MGTRTSALKERKMWKAISLGLSEAWQFLMVTVLRLWPWGGLEEGKVLRDEKVQETEKPGCWVGISTVSFTEADQREYAEREMENQRVQPSVTEDMGSSGGVRQQDPPVGRAFWERIGAMDWDERWRSRRPQHYLMALKVGDSYNQTDSARKNCRNTVSLGPARL